MSAHVVVIGRVGLEKQAQVSLTSHHDVVKATAPNRADQPLDVSVVPWRTRRDWVIADRGEQSLQPHPNQTIDVPQPAVSSSLAAEHQQLLAEDETSAS